MKTGFLTRPRYSTVFIGAAVVVASACSGSSGPQLSASKDILDVILNGSGDAQATVKGTVTAHGDAMPVAGSTTGTTIVAGSGTITAAEIE